VPLVTFDRGFHGCTVFPAQIGGGRVQLICSIEVRPRRLIARRGRRSLDVRSSVVVVAGTGTAFLAQAQRFGRHVIGPHRTEPGIEPQRLGMIVSNLT
jgi:hypothetical protein